MILFKLQSGKQEENVKYISEQGVEVSFQANYNIGWFRNIIPTFTSQRIAKRVVRKAVIFGMDYQHWPSIIQVNGEDI